MKIDFSPDGERARARPAGRARSCAAEEHAWHDHANAGQTRDQEKARRRLLSKSSRRKNPRIRKRSAKKPAHNAQPPPMPMDRGRMTMPMPDTSSGEATPPGTGAMPTMDHDQAGAMPMQHGAMAGHDMAMTGALGPYPMERESSGTAWQPDTSEHMGLMIDERRLDADGARRAQPRRTTISPARAATTRRFASRHADGHGAAAARQRHAAVQGDGQPRPADGHARLSAAARQRRDRQRHRPADRPPAPARFLHGAVGLGLAEHRAEEQRLPLRRPARRARLRPARLHAPRGDHGFARSADQPSLARFDPHQLRRRRPPGWCSTGSSSRSAGSTAASPTSIAGTSRPGRSNSTAVRLSWNPTRTLALQGSWGHFTDPEQLEPGVDQKRWSASLLYARRDRARLEAGRHARLGPQDRPKATDDDAFAAEASLKHGGWTLFGRGEMTENRELIGDPRRPRLSRRQGFARRRPRLPGRRAFVARRRRPVRGQFRAGRAGAALRRAQPDRRDGLRPPQARLID